MQTYIVTLTREFKVPVLADSEELAVARAMELMTVPDAIYETDQEDYTATKVVAIQHNSTAREEAEENEVIYSNFND